MPTITTGLNTPYTSGYYSGGYYNPLPQHQTGPCPGCGHCRCCGQPAAAPFVVGTIGYSGTNTLANYQNGTLTGASMSTPSLADYQNVLNQYGR